MNPDSKKRCRQCNAWSERKTRRTRKQQHNFRHPRLHGTGIRTGGNLTTSTHFKNGVTTEHGETFVLRGSLIVEGRVSTYRRIWIFFLFGYHEIGNRWRQSTFTDGGCRGITSYFSYLRTKDTSNYGYDNINLEPNAMNNIDTVAHMHMHYTQYWAHRELFLDAQLCHIAPVAQDCLARVIPSMHVHLCVALWLISQHPSPVFYFVPPFSF